MTSIKDFGAFIEIVPGRDGLCHISELDRQVRRPGRRRVQGRRQLRGEGDRHRRPGPRQAVAQGAARGTGTGRRPAAGTATARAAARRPRRDRGERPRRRPGRPAAAGAADGGRRGGDRRPRGRSDHRTRRMTAVRSRPLLTPLRRARVALLAARCRRLVNRSCSAEQLAELAELAGGFIHEIKNHLSTLGLNLQLLAEDFAEPQSPRERRAKQRIDRLQGECAEAGRRLQRLPALRPLAGPEAGADAPRRRRRAR